MGFLKKSVNMFINKIVIARPAEGSQSNLMCAIASSSAFGGLLAMTFWDDC